MRTPDMKSCCSKYGFALREGKTLEHNDGEVFHLLAVHERHERHQSKVSRQGQPCVLAACLPGE